MRKLWRTVVIVAAVAALPLMVLMWPLSMFAVVPILMEFGKSPSFLPLHGKNVSVSATYDTFTDGRDGKEYRMIQMPDGRTWMAENLDYQTDSSWYYKDSFFGIPFQYKEYGRLYDWAAAITACPNGWRLPSFGEWDSLAQAVGGVKEANTYGGIYWHGAGKKLKAKRGWVNERYDEYLGTDDYGFRALPGGFYIDDIIDYDFCYVGVYGYWWTATEINNDDYVYVMEINYRGDYSAYHGYKGHGYSVRCVADAP